MNFTSWIEDFVPILKLRELAGAYGTTGCMVIDEDW